MDATQLAEIRERHANANDSTSVGWQSEYIADVGDLLAALDDQDRIIAAHDQIVEAGGLPKLVTVNLVGRDTPLSRLFAEHVESVLQNYITEQKLLTLTAAPTIADPDDDDDDPEDTDIYAPDMGEPVATCACPSLLNGHDNGCHLAKGGS